MFNLPGAFTTSFGKTCCTNRLEFDKSIWLVSSLAYRYPVGGELRNPLETMQCSVVIILLDLYISKTGVKIVVNDLVA